MIIKCPECGHEVSDHAPVCPNCGVEIAGHITRCPVCGKIYFSNQPYCPDCHHATGAPVASAAAPVPPPVPPTTGSEPSATQGNDPHGNKPNGKKKKGAGTVLLISLLIAAIICGSMYYFYHQAQTSKEEEEYENALSSSDPLVLEQYLNDYSGVNQAHTDSIEAHLSMLRQNDQDYQNAINTNSKSALQSYLDTHPNTTHRGEILAKIDSIDWAAAVSINSPESYKQYLAEHSDGDHAEEASAKVEQLNATVVTPQEKQLVQSSLRSFFQAINGKNEQKLSNAVTPVMDSFLGKNDATSSDVVEFMDKIYKDDVTNMNFHLGTPSGIKKQNEGDGTFSYKVDVPAKQVVETTGGELVNQLRISAIVEADGRISSMSMKKIVNN